MEQPHLYYHNKDFPVFHYMQFPELAAFEFFFWKRTLIGNPELARQQFNGEEPNNGVIETAKKNIGHYIQIPSTEI